MKTTFKLLSVVFLLIALFIGCKKNQTSENIKDKSTSVDQQKIESVVKYCANRVTHSLKTTDSIPIDSVEFYLTSTANYIYGISSAQGDMQQIDSNFFTIPFSNGKIAMIDVDSIYTKIMDGIRVSYRVIQSSNKNLLVTMVKNNGSKQNRISLKATSIILYGNYNILAFDTTDYWLFQGAPQCYGGKCGPYFGQGDLCQDAATKIASRVMELQGTSSGCFVLPYYTQPINPGSFHNPFYNPNDGANYFYYMFFANTPNALNYHGCLMPFEMNKYRWLASYCVNTSNTQQGGAKPDGYTFMSLYLVGELEVGNGDEYHLGNIYYGTYLPGGYQSPL
jgi:hypothetical protein